MLSVILLMPPSNGSVEAFTLYRNLLASPFLLIISQLHLLLSSQEVIMMKTKGLHMSIREIAMPDSRREEMLERKKPLEVFCSYARADEALCEKLRTHLSSLERQGLLTVWYDRFINAGTDRAGAINEHLSTASLILLLISSDFIDADYCYGIEMQRALEKHRMNEARVIPILLRPVDWQDAPFAHLQPLPINRKPITKWENRDEAFLSIATGIRQVIKEVQSLSLSAPHTTLPSVWNIPSPRNFLFVGREDILARLYRNFHGASQRPQAISGLGGIGKSQIAVEYAYRHSQEYRAVLWIGAESRESLVSGYVTAAGLLNLPEKDEKDQAVVVWAVRRWLETHREWLLILDNADDLSLAREFLPSTFEGHIMLTTRAQAMGRLADRLEIDTLEQEIAALFLLRRAGLIDSVAPLEEARGSDIAAAREICTELGGLPLALDQAGAYIEEMQCGLSRYLANYQTRRKDLLRWRGKIVLDHPDPVEDTWSISFEKVEQRNPVAANLLRLCAYFSPDDIPEELIMQGANFPGLEALAEDTLAFDGASAELRNYSLLQRDGEARTLSVHRLVQSVLRDSMDAAIQRDWAQRAIRVVNMAFPEVEFAAWSQCERYLPHALACIKWIEQEQLSSIEAAQVLLKVGWYLKDRVRYKEAEPLIRQALEMNSQHLPPDSVDIAQALTILAEMYHAWGYYAEAEPPYQKALTIYERLGSEHPYTISSMSNLASLYSSQGKYKEAERLYQRVLTSREKDLGPEHLDTARSLSNLGCCYGDEGKYTEAESLLKRALAIYERQLSPDDPELADVLNNLAELYCQQGKYSLAEPLYQRALAICKQQLGQDHPDTANCMHNLATLYYEQRKYAKAESLLEQVLAICEQKLGPDHPDTAHCLRNLARLYDRQDRNAEAKPLYLKALEICEQQLGHDHPHTRSTREKYEDLLRKMETEESEKIEARDTLPSQTS
jgi:tetratricopeptide (TPR) repeat protein